MAIMDLASAVETQQRDAARRAELDQREREYGGLIPGDRESEARRRSVKGWGPYRPDVTRADVERARVPQNDPRRVTIQRLYVDCGAAVRRFAPRYRRSAAETLRNDALLLLLRWEQHGDARRLDLGGAGGAPMRRDWLEPTGATGRAPREKLTELAWRALRAAVKQASEAPAMRELMADDVEIPTDPLDIASAVETQQRETDAATRLPDSMAPEVIAATMDIPLDAARAIVARAYPAATSSDLASAWRISPDSLKVALSRGAAQIRARFPDPSELLDALDSAGARWRAESERSAILALIAYRDGYGEETDALDSVRDWRGATDGIGWQARALLAATRAALQREGASYGDARAERIARSVPRLMRAEQRRALAQANVR